METWHTAIKGWIEWLRAGGSRPATLTLRRHQLHKLASAHPDAPPWSLTTAHLTAWLSGRGWAAETLRSHISAVRSFYGWAHADGRTGSDPARLLRVPRRNPPRPRPAAERVVQRAVTAADPRTRLMLELSAFYGLRRGEVARVRADDLLEDPDGWLLVVHGKGGKEREVPLADRTAEQLLERGPGWVFPNPSGSDHLTAGHVGRLMSAALGPGVVPHQLRHRFATTAYRRTSDLLSVQQLLGHASPATTQIYVAVDVGALRRAVASAA